MICKLTRYYIERGKRASCVSCPISLAINDAIDVPGVWYEIASGQCVAGRPRDGLPSQVSGNPVFVLPRKCDRFITLFDSCVFEADRAKLQPFEFDIPDSFVEAVREKFLK